MKFRLDMVGGSLVNCISTKTLLRFFASPSDMLQIANVDPAIDTPFTLQLNT